MIIKKLLNKYDKKIIIIYYYGSIYNYKSTTNKIANKEIKATNIDELSKIYSSSKRMLDSLSELNSKFKEYSENL